MERYKSLAAGIYRKDIHYANILPKAIVAAQNVYSEKDYIEVAKAYANDLLENTPKDEDHWSQRYFVAQVYMDLYAKTNDPSYLEKAYEIIYENTTCLLKEQREINATYLNEVKEITVEEPNYDYMPDKEKEEAKKKYKEEKKRANEYNKALKEARKTEIPTLYDPLIMHCELLFQLAEKRNISESEKQELISIMNPDEKKVFLPQAVVDFYSFSNPDRQYSLSMNKTEIIIPVTLLTAGSVITVTVTEGDTHNVYEDCVITKVIRKANMFDWFEAHVSSKKLQAHSWTDHSKITITIHYADVYDKSNSFNFYVSKYDPHWYGDNMEFTLE